MKIANFDLTKQTFILAEIGTNHNGDFELAKKLLHEAVQAGANGVKFQTFNPDTLFHKEMPTFAHARGIHKTQRERAASLALTLEQFAELKKIADSLGVIFLSTPLDHEAVDYLDPLMPAHKVASGDITNIPLLKHIREKEKPVILSTGTASEEEIKTALDIFDKDQIVLLHCVANYPTAIENANLRSILFLQERFQVPVGYSDHTIGIEACKTAVALGAVFIEKHFTLDKTLPLGDHKLSASPEDLKLLESSVRDIEKSLGIFGKPVEGERKAAELMRRSLYASQNIKEGEVLTADKTIAMRPADGLSPAELESLIGKKTKRSIKKDTLLDKEMFA